jgi:hypothetical protein
MMTELRLQPEDDQVPARVTGRFPVYFKYLCRVKKYCFYILLLLSSIAAFRYAGQAPAEDKAVLLTGQVAYSTASLHVPFADMESFTAQGSAIAHANQGVKKISDNSGGLNIKQPVLYSFLFSSCGSAVNGFHSKSYLTHIHPSHHFW